MGIFRLVFGKITVKVYHLINENRMNILEQALEMCSVSIPIEVKNVVAALSTYHDCLMLETLSDQIFRICYVLDIR